MSEGPVVALVLVAPADAGGVARALGALGFDVGPHVGIAMAVTAPRDTFERVFGTRVRDADDGGWVAADGRRELPLDRLPPELAAPIDAVTFDEPAELTP